jgi:HlyD family secretion protein
MKKRIKTTSLCILLLLPLAWTGCRKAGETARQAEVSGIIEAVKTDIRSQAQGEIQEILVKEGQKVGKGDLLCRIDADKLRIQMDQVKAGLDAAQARLRLVKKGTKKELVAVAENQMEIAAKQLELAEKDQQRLARLLGEGAVSVSQKEKADLAFKAAQEQYNSAKENHDLAVRGREKEEIEMAEAEIQGLKAQEQLLQRLLLDTVVRAPAAGVVEVKHVEVGELAVAGGMLFSLIDLDQTYVKAYVPEKYMGQVKLGSRVAVTCDSFPAKAFEGKVDYISDEAEFAPKNVQTKEERLKLVYQIKSYLPNQAGELKPGMSVDVKISFD